MPSPGLSLPPDAIRIEDEVWQEAFSRREPARSRAPRSASPAPRPAPTKRGPVAPAKRGPVAPVKRGPVAPVRAATAGRDRPAVPAASRRAVTITGRGAERHLPWPGDPGRRPVRRAHERSGFKPDRVAMWAVFLGVLLLAVA